MGTNKLQHNIVNRISKGTEVTGAITYPSESGKPPQRRLHVRQSVVYEESLLIKLKEDEDTLQAHQI